MRSHDFACTMSQGEAEARVLVALQQEFVGKISFEKDDFTTQELGLKHRVVGVTSMADYWDTALLRLYGFRVAAVLKHDLSLDFD